MKKLLAVMTNGLLIAGLLTAVSAFAQDTASNADKKETNMKKSIGAKTIVFPTPVFIVGSYDKAGKPNEMTVAWGGICCSTPPCVGIAIREATLHASQLHQ